AGIAEADQKKHFALPILPARLRTGRAGLLLLVAGLGVLGGRRCGLAGGRRWRRPCGPGGGRSPCPGPRRAWRPCRREEPCPEPRRAPSGQSPGPLPVASRLRQQRLLLLLPPPP